MITDPYKYLIELILGLLICFFFTYIGYHYEKTKFDQFKVEVAVAGKVQEDEAKLKDKEVTQNAIQAQTDSTNAITSITDYYKRNPVRVCGNTGSSTTTKADTSAGSVNNPSSGDLPITYASEYNPEEVELIASQLDQLLKLLKDDGVIFDANN